MFVSLLLRVYLKNLVFNLSFSSSGLYETECKKGNHKGNHLFYHSRLLSLKLQMRVVFVLL